METQLNEIREQQRETWNKFSGGWKKWNDFNMNFLKPMGDEIIKELGIRENDKVLDVASGTGEPALTIASITKKGKVIATDLSEQMLEGAQENAVNKGISNFEVVVADVCELPFQDNSFDKISCRMGFMFFPDMQLAAKEMFRVLKTGGRIATCVWGQPEKNLWASGPRGIINKNMQITPSPPGAPSLFRCAQPGLVKSLLENAGFKNVKEQEINGKVRYESFDHFWTMTNEVAAPVAGAMSGADDDMRSKIKSEVKSFLDQYPGEEGIELEYCSLILSGDK